MLCLLYISEISSFPTSVWTKALLVNPAAECCARIAKLVTTESSENKSQALLWAKQNPDDMEGFQDNFQDKVIRAPKHWAAYWLQSWIDQIHEKFNGFLPISWSKSCSCTNESLSICTNLKIPAPQTEKSQDCSLFLPPFSRPHGAI